MAIKIISLSGYIGSGKNFFCEILKIELRKKNQVWHQKSHAEKLKQICSLLLNIPRAKFEDAEFKKTSLGSEWDRSIDQAIEWMHMKELAVPLVAKEALYPLAIKYGFKFTRTVREFMQELGTDAIRYHLCPDTWLNAMWADYRPVPTISTHEYGHRILQDWQAMPEDPNWILTDTRFANEIAAAKNRNGILIRINRGVRTSDHPSEVTIDTFKDWDYIVDNTGDYESLVLEAQKFIHHFNL